MAQVTGSLISAVKDACRNGLLDWSPRLMLAMYSCDIQASSTPIYLVELDSTANSYFVQLMYWVRCTASLRDAEDASSPKR